MRLGVQDIAIERLRISGDQLAAQAFARELEESSWPLQLPANVQHAWIFVRELQVHGKPQELRENTAHQLEQLLARAIDGRHASANALAVRFDSLPQLLAFLVRDLALGRANGKWYWERWNYLLHVNPEHALAQLLIEYITELPALVEQLSALGYLSLLWQSLSSDSAARVVAHIERHYGFSTERNLSSDDVTGHSSIQQHAARIFQQKPALLRNWQNLIDSIPLDDKRWVLAGVLTGISCCPLLLLRNSRAVINAFIAHLGGNFTAFANPIFYSANDGGANNVNAISPGNNQKSQLNPSVQISNSEARPGDKNAIGKAEKIKFSVQYPASQASSYLGFPDNALSQGISEQNTNNNAAELKNPEALSQSVAQSFASNNRDTENIPLSLSPVYRQFITACGGFFYLINALRMVITAEFLAGQSQANGWLWWFDLGRLLAQRFDIRLDDSLARFVAASLGIDDLQELIKLPVCAEAHNFLSGLDKIFLQQPFWSEHTSSRSGFMAIHAQVVADASYIDIYFPANFVRLDIRFAGLDVDPGWVPWLGRVVRFHYMDSSIPVTGVHQTGTDHAN